MAANAFLFVNRPATLHGEIQARSNRGFLSSNVAVAEKIQDRKHQSNRQ
jgi:hypothetical protein